MRIIEVNYVSGLASFLDEKGVKFTNTSDGNKARIEIQYRNKKQLLKLVNEFQTYYNKFILGE